MDYRLATTGELRQLDVSYVFVPPDRVMVHADDITELRENEERLRAVIATFEAGLLTIDLNGRVTDANPAACAIFGLDRERLLNDPGVVAVARAALRGRQPALRCEEAAHDAVRRRGGPRRHGAAHAADRRRRDREGEPPAAAQRPRRAARPAS